MRHGPRDRHHLPVRQREIADASLEVEGQPHAIGDRPGLGTDAGRLEQRRGALAAQPVERQVGGDVEIGHHAVIDVLVDGDDTGADGFGGRPGIEGLPGKPHRAAAAFVDAADDLDQGGLAGAVGAHQHGYLARMQFNRDAAKHLVLAEGFPQALHTEHGICAHSFLPDHDAMGCIGNCQHD